MSETLTRVFKKLVETPMAVWLTIASIVLIAVVIFVIAKDKKRWSVNMLVTGAICLAIAFVLSCIRLYRMPQGGSITLVSMLPIFVFAYIFGFTPALLVGLAYGMLQLMQDPFFLNPVQLIVDYALPFVALALGGAFRDAKSIPEALRLPLGVLCGSLARVLFHTLSGVAFFAEYAGDMNPWIYSIGYNMSSVGVDGAICLVIAFVPPVSKMVEMLRKKQAEIKKPNAMSASL